MSIDGHDLPHTVSNGKLISKNSKVIKCTTDMADEPAKHAQTPDVFCLVPHVPGILGILQPNWGLQRSGEVRASSAH